MTDTLSAHNGHTDGTPETRGRAAGASGKASFTLAPASRSPSTSRSPSRAPIRVAVDASPGQRARDVYDATLPPWRAAVRRALLARVAAESPPLGRMQARLRSPFWDRYMVYSSSLGTHTFFMTALPVCFWFGFPDLGRGLILVLAGGVYVTSLVKDLFCSPRPFAPPLTRLTISTHHLEYGFPSTHSTNSASIVLFVGAHILSLYTAGTLSGAALGAWMAGLNVYLVSVVFGRLYTGMHSVTDCTAGVVIGVIVWAAYALWEGVLERLVTTSGAAFPLGATILALVLVHKHPQPVDDCPCFEDAIAFIAVSLGLVGGWWYAGAGPVGAPMPGASFATQADVVRWAAFAALKMVVGIVVVFGWRLLAKATLRALLPPLFRALATRLALPTRRFYTPATDYDAVPADPRGALRSVPSMLDLPQSPVLEETDVDVDMSAGRRRGVVRRRTVGEDGCPPASSVLAKDGHVQLVQDGEEVEIELVKHYDADVLTKVIVYVGIGVLATSALPVLFATIGWGV